MTIIDPFLISSFSSPSHVAACVSYPFGTKKWITFPTLYAMIFEIPKYIRKNMFIHTLYFGDDSIVCQIDYTMSGTLGTMKIYPGSSEQDNLMIQFFTEKYSPKTGCIFTCSIYEIDGSNARIPMEDLQRVFVWCKQMLPNCSVDESCKITNITCGTFSRIQRILSA